MNKTIDRRDNIEIKKKTVEILFAKADEGGIDAYALYSFYMFHAEKQDMSGVRATNTYCMDGLCWGKVRFQRAKKMLLEYGMIEERRDKDEKGCFTKCYIYVKYKPQASLSTGSIIPPVDNGRQVQGEDIEVQGEDKKEKLYKKNSSPSAMADEFYSLYPRKV